jgi:hypothetical protein
MFKKILIVLMIGCFLLGMATRAEAENVKEEAEEEVMSDSTTADFGTTTTESESNSKTHYQISAATVSKLALGDTITNMIFGETEMLVSDARALGVKGLEQKRADEKIRVKYPKVVMVSDKKSIGRPKAKSLKFFDGKGKLKKEISVQEYVSERKGGPASVEIPKGGKYLAINAPIEADEKGIWGKNTVVFNADGDRLWGFDHGLVSVYLSPNGEYMVGQGWESGPVIVYSKKGEILKEIDNDGFSDISFSDNGSYFAVILKGVDREMETERYVDRVYANLIVVNAQGAELWRKERIARGMAYGAEVKISNDVISVITGVGEYKMYSFDRNGKLLKTEQGDVEQLRNFKN